MKIRPVCVRAVKKPSPSAASNLKNSTTPYNTTLYYFFDFGGASLRGVSPRLLCLFEDFDGCSVLDDSVREIGPRTKG